MIHVFLILLVSLPSYAEFDDFIYSAGAGTNSITNRTTLSKENRSPLLTFDPNVSGSLSVGVETKYIDLFYGFATGSSDPDLEASKYQDFRINGTWEWFDFRLNYQRYKGAKVDDAGARVFYKDYEAKSTNGRANYYFKKEYLKYIRDGHERIKRVSTNSGITFSGSWLAGLNVDKRSIKLPELVVAHQDRVNSNGLIYDRHLEAFLFGPLAGGDGTLYLYRGFLRGKFGIGPAFVIGGTSVFQSELAFSTGFVIGARHLISLGVDLYSVNFESKSSEIGSSNSQANLSYTYSFK